MLPNNTVPAAVLLTFSTHLQILETSEVTVTSTEKSAPLTAVSVNHLITATNVVATVTSTEKSAHLTISTSSLTSTATSPHTRNPHTTTTRSLHTASVSPSTRSHHTASASPHMRSHHTTTTRSPHTANASHHTEDNPVTVTTIARSPDTKLRPRVSNGDVALPFAHVMLLAGTPSPSTATGLMLPRRKRLLLPHASSTSSDTPTPVVPFCSRRSLTITPPSLESSQDLPQASTLSRSTTLVIWSTDVNPLVISTTPSVPTRVILTMTLRTARLVTSSRSRLVSLVMLNT